MNVVKFKKKRQQTAWSKYCTEVYYSMRDAQLKRVEEWAIGYETEERFYYENIEPRITFKDVLISLKGNWQASHMAA
ncbi:hypothetical protein FDI69_gp129 [Rhodococcus phage Trina]|uniref:Uncharacterized protein n=1 Tax=Rhodococcus phage Trina TaxID=2027905 RepID=A0A2D1A4K8_9CAUD|nr:hypothetical protein FDI69_gp129 [Rhodococcus phage Trina]ASZ75056.1 hypothetical protein SEA_TRINA_278 [Rhodococcus phage Trina]